MAKYFTLKELCESREATRRSIDNFPSFEIAAHLQELTDKILDPLRWAWGGAINVTSGYRCELLNAAVGGVKTSVHRLGWAADLQPANGRTEEFIAFAREWAEKSHIRFDQFIRERDKSGHVWLHIGLYSPTGSQRGQFLDIVKK